MANANTASNSVLASIFVLSLLMMFLIPFTLHRIFNRPKSKPATTKRLSDTESHLQVLKAAPRGSQTVKQRSGRSSAGANGIFTFGNVSLVLLWLFAAALLVHIRSAAEEVRPFDPFEILGVAPGATDKEVKRAYRQLSLKFHPDKNPDPAAANYFAEFISPAYKALTDEVAKANLEKHGHPDGPQGMSVGVALPAFLFEKGRAAPIVLGAIVGVGILLPLALVVCYITRQSQYTSNNILQQTLHAFFYLTEQKNSLTTSKVADILICASEYLQMPVRRSDEEPLQKLMTELRGDLDLKDAKFLKLHPAAKKALILLTAQVTRQSAAIPDALQDDFLRVIGLVPALLEELITILLRPRPPFGYFRLRPVLSALEYSQGLTQALPVGIRQDKSTMSDSAYSLMQLPHMDANTIKKLNRSKVRSLYDLMMLDDASRDEAVVALGLTAAQRKDFQAFTGAVPCVSLEASCETEGEEGGDILEGDIATCNVHISLERLVSSESIHTPFFPVAKEESWWVLLADVSSNTLYAAQKVNLVTRCGLKRFRAVRSTPQSASASAAPAAPSTDAAQPGVAAAAVTVKTDDHVVGDLVLPLKFRAPPSGVHLLQVMCISDYWIGCDRTKPLKLKVGKLSKAERQKRAPEADDQASQNSDGGEDDGAESSASENEAVDDGDLTESGTSESSDDDE